MRKLKKCFRGRKQIIQPISFALVKESNKNPLRHIFKVGDCVRVLEHLDYKNLPLVVHCFKNDIHQYIFTEDLLLC